MTDAYAKALVAARDHHCRSVAFHSYRSAAGLECLKQVYKAFAESGDLDIYISVPSRRELEYSSAAITILRDLFCNQELQEFRPYLSHSLNDEWADSECAQSSNPPVSREHLAPCAPAPYPSHHKEDAFSTDRQIAPIEEDDTSVAAAPIEDEPPLLPYGCFEKVASAEPSDYALPNVGIPLAELTDLLKKHDAGFSETLLRFIDQSGKKDSEIYKKANIDRKLFSKIKNVPGYNPSKPTAIAFAIALELDMAQTKDLIGRAGYTLSSSSKFDTIISYFIEHKNYDIFEINEVLFYFDQNLLGC